MTGRCCPCKIAEAEFAAAPAGDIYQDTRCMLLHSLARRRASEYGQMILFASVDLAFFRQVPPFFHRFIYVLMTLTFYEVLLMLRRGLMLPTHYLLRISALCLLESYTLLALYRRSTVETLRFRYLFHGFTIAARLITAHAHIGACRRDAQSARHTTCHEKTRFRASYHFRMLQEDASALATVTQPPHARSSPAFFQMSSRPTSAPGFSPRKSCFIGRRTLKDNGADCQYAVESYAMEAMSHFYRYYLFVFAMAFSCVRFTCRLTIAKRAPQKVR